MSTKISAITIGEYIDCITVLWFADGRSLPPTNVADYLPFVQIMFQHAQLNGELDHLKLAFEHLLTSPEIDCEQFDGGNYPFDDQELRTMIAFAYSAIWNNMPLPPKRYDIEIVGEYTVLLG